MPNTETKVWVYLTKRNKEGVRFIAQFKGNEEISPTRITDFSNLGLDVSYVNQLMNVVYEARLLWEAWIETGDSFDAMKAKIKKRGYTNLPISFLPEVGGNNFLSSPTIYTRNFNKTKIMTRKKV